MVEKKDNDAPVAMDFSDMKLGWESWFDSSVRRCIASPDFNSFRLAVDMLESFVLGYRLRIRGNEKVPLSLSGKDYPEDMKRYFEAVNDEENEIVKKYGGKDSSAVVPLYKYKFILLLSLIKSITPEKLTMVVR